MICVVSVGCRGGLDFVTKLVLVWLRVVRGKFRSHLRVQTRKTQGLPDGVMAAHGPLEA